MCAELFPISKVAKMEASLAGLPPDCLRIVLSKVDYGSNKLAVLALAGSCKTIQQALKDCPAVVELQGNWDRRQLLGGDPPHFFRDFTTCFL